LIVDAASGLTMTKKGDYIEQKWIRKKKEFITLHIVVDAKSEKIISFRITKGNIHDSKMFSPMIREAYKEYDIDKVYADKAHDNRCTFNLLENQSEYRTSYSNKKECINQNKRISITKR
jgi:hypothetical protein